MANNTPLEEFASLKDVKPTENAQVQGIVMSVTPMKKGQFATYFDAKITDEEKEIRVVGFSSNLRKRMAALEDKEEPVTLENCRIKKARFSDDLEIIVKPATTVHMSPKKLDISKVIRSPISHRSVGSIDSCNNYDKVSISAKVLSIQTPIKVAGGLTKQEVTVADDTGAIKVTLWECFIGYLHDETSYELKNLTVRTFKGEKYLVSSKRSC